MAVSFTLLIDYGLGFVDESVYLRDFTIKQGMPINDRLACIADIGTADFILDNATRRFSERNASSPLYGLNEEVTVVFRVDNESGAGQRLLFRGFGLAWVSDGEQYGTNEIRLHCVDILYYLKNHYRVTSIEGAKGADLDTVVDFIIDQAGISFSLSIETSGNILTQGLLGIEVQRTSIYDALRLIAEHDFGRIYVSPASNVSDSFLFEPRYYFITSTGGAFPTLTDEDFEAFQDRRDYGDAVRAVQLTIYPQRTIAAEGVLWQAGATIRIPGGQTRVLSLAYRDPDTGRLCEAVDVVTPVAGTDYTVVTEVNWPVTNAVGVSVQKELRRAIVTVSNPFGFPVFFTLFRIRGKPVVTYEPLTMESGSGIGTVFDFPMRVQPEDAVQVLAYIPLRYQSVHHCEWCELRGDVGADYDNFIGFANVVQISESQSGLNSHCDKIRRREIYGNRGKTIIRYYFEGLPPHGLFQISDLSESYFGSLINGPDIIVW